MKTTPKIVVLAALLFSLNFNGYATVITSLPYKIEKPGHYELNSDLTYTGSDVAITIEASNVTLDLNGYTLQTNNPPGGPGPTAIVIASAGTHPVAHFINDTIKNGTILAFETAISIHGSAFTAQALTLVENYYGFFLESDVEIGLIQNCFMIGTDYYDGTGVYLLEGVTGVQIKNNQISSFDEAIHSQGTDNAHVHNFITNCEWGLILQFNDSYQDTVVTGSTNPYLGGTKVGDNNG
jgi:hypothetical protein